MSKYDKIYQEFQTFQDVFTYVSMYSKGIIQDWENGIESAQRLNDCFFAISALLNYPLPTPFVILQYLVRDAAEKIFEYEIETGRRQDV